jgi:hypothetical protein
VRTNVVSRGREVWGHWSLMGVIDSSSTIRSDVNGSVACHRGVRAGVSLVTSPLEQQLNCGAPPPTSFQVTDWVYSFHQQIGICAFILRYLIL